MYEGAGDVGKGGKGLIAVVGRGVDEVAFDFTDEATWAAAFRGVDRMFVVRPPALGRPRTQMIPALTAARTSGAPRGSLPRAARARRARCATSSGSPP